MKSLVTGIHGFVGSHLKEYLESIGHEVVGAQREFDSNYLKNISPDYIFHFAGFSSNIDSFDNPKEAFDVNLLGTLSLLEAVKNSKINPKILFAGSSEEYGKVDLGRVPVRENAPLFPQNPYAVSKVAASLLCYQYAMTYKLNIVRVRSFNQEGPGRQERYVISSLAKQIAEIEAGIKKPIINVGNIQVSRDFIDVRDASAAYLSLITKGVSSEVYNVCSGIPRKIDDILKKLISLSSVKNIKVENDKGKFRANELISFYGDNSKLKKATDWVPVIPFEKTLLDTLNYWRGKASK